MNYLYSLGFLQRIITKKFNYLKYFYTLSIIFSLFNFGTINSKLIEKNILVLVFPGGKSHNFVMKELFDYSLENQKTFKYNYHILVHNWDKDAWDNAGHDYTIHGFGDNDLFDKIFNSALELVRIDPIFGYTNFNKAMLHILDQFMKSELLEEFRKLKYDMIISDIPNFLMKFLRTELKIPLVMYLCPPGLPNIFYELFEINPATLPAIGTKFTDSMTFLERVQNAVYVAGTKIMFKIFMTEHTQVFKNYGYDVEPNVFIYDSLVLIQFPIGFSFNISKPPSMIFLNYITPKPAKKLEDLKLSNFLNIYKKNIYMSQGTIMKNINFSDIMKIFEHHNKVGFVLSIKTEVSKNLIFPTNVFLTNWVNQNDLLGDERINGFITHAGINSVMEAIYHKKPIIALGVSLDQINTGAMVKTRDVGIVFSSFSDLTPEKLIPAIDEILLPNNHYLKNVLKYSAILEMNEPSRETYTYWLFYGFELGYDHLNVKAYSELTFVGINNLDVGIFFIFIFFLFFYCLKKIFNFFCYRRIKNLSYDEKIKLE